MATKAEKLLKQLQIDGIVGATGKINANFELKTGSLNIQKQIMRPSSVGQIIEEWLSAYMDEKNIYYRAQKSQESPDYFLNEKSDNKDLLEVKVYGKSAAFDLGNVRGVCNTLPDEAYKLDMDYLIIHYVMDSVTGNIIIRDIWLRKIWQVAGKEITSPYRLSRQVKNNQVTTIRPIGMKKPNPKAEFTDVEYYLHALYIEYAEIEKTKKKQEEWLKKIVANYNKFKKAEILDYDRILSK